MCYKCQTAYLAVLCHFVADLGAGTQKPHSKSIQNHSLTSLNYLICQLICIQTMNHLGKISCNCLGREKIEKRRRYFSIFKVNTIFFPLFFFFSFSFGLLSSTLAISFLYMNYISKCKVRILPLFIPRNVTVLFIFYLCFHHYPFLFCISSAFSLSP